LQCLDQRKKDDVTTKFLSEDWADKMTAVAKTDPTLQTVTKGQSCVLQMNISGSPGSDTFYVGINDGTTEFVLGAPEKADVQGNVTYDTMCALARGDLGGQQAAMTGQMKVSGDMMKMMNIGRALDELPRLTKDIGVEF
jgi:putative sterol carrier protein